MLRQVDNSEIILAERYANEYNAAISPGTQLSDAFSKEALLWASEDYENLLNLAGDGIMGYIEIPSIRCSLPIYHGTDESVLQVATGHIEGSSLPVGGAGSHCVISGHRGLPSARLFSGLDQLKIGDFFNLRVLNRTLQYQIDEINIVLPDDIGKLEIDPEKDFCTLVTCTPYGVNSHRILVRGSRVEKQNGDRD